ncbi:transcription antitermination protein NusB [Cellulosimicrobium funkei]
MSAERRDRGGSNARSNKHGRPQGREGGVSNKRSSGGGQGGGNNSNARSNSGPAPAGGGDERRDARGRQRGAARSRGEAHRSSAAPSQRRKGTDPARAVAYDVLRQVDGSDAYANLVLPPLLRERGIRGRDAGFATELAYGTLRLRGRYDAILAHCLDRPLDRLDPPVLDVLRLGTHQLLAMRVPQHAAVSETVGLARERTGAGSAQLVNAVLRRVARTPLADWLTTLADDAPDPLAALAATQSHPVWIARALRDALAGNGRPVDELDALLAADNAAPRVTLVARPGLADPHEHSDGAGRLAPARGAPADGPGWPGAVSAGTGWGAAVAPPAGVDAPAVGSAPGSGVVLGESVGLGDALVAVLDGEGESSDPPGLHAARARTRTAPATAAGRRPGAAPSVGRARRVRTARRVVMRSILETPGHARAAGGPRSGDGRVTARSRGPCTLS